MKTVGIIAEYNPFHKGHAYQIREAKKKAGAQYCVIAMSGNFLQRGEAACMDKFSRAKCALLAGADLVLELPVPFATATAPLFARSGVQLLKQTGVVTHLSFGCEDDRLQALQFLASFFAKEPSDYKAFLTEGLRSGLSYPAARKAALLQYGALHPSCLTAYGQSTLFDLADLLDTPNNILAIAYLRALKSCAPLLTPLPIKREGSGYHDDALCDTFSSARSIRKALFAEGPTPALLSALPEETVPVFMETWEKKAFVSTDSFSSLLYYKLLSLSQQPSPSKAYEAYAEISKPLANRIEKNLPKFTSFSQFTRLLMRKNETYSTISRGLLHILLDLKKDCFFEPSYLRILGFRKEAGPLLHEMKEKSLLPILTKAANGPSLPGERTQLLLQKDFFAENLYHSLFRSQSAETYHPFLRTPVRL
jgi:predicted nucleotidyltransferase